MATAGAFDHTDVKRAIMIGATHIVYRPVAGTVAVAVTLAKEC